MPALHVEFTDDELAIVRSAAGSSDTLLRAFAKQAILDKATNRDERVRAIAAEVADRSAELNQRLA